jgi:hypothetical protein
MPKNFAIFISYRRKGGYDTAKLVYDRLRLDGYSVFFDMDSLENGNFDNELEKKVKKCKDFLLILSPGIFDRFSETGYDIKDDWVRQEVVCAIKTNKNIVPLALEGFVFPKRLPTDIKDINRKNSIDLNPRHFDAVYEKMKESFLLSKPRLAIRHKKRIWYFISAVLLIIAAYLSWAIFTIYRQADDAKNEAEIVIIKQEAEITRLRDSIRFAKEAEIAMIRDSINIVKAVEIAILKDSIAAYIELLKNVKESNKKNLEKMTPAKPVSQTQNVVKKPTQQPKDTKKSTTTKGSK